MLDLFLPAYAKVRKPGGRTELVSGVLCERGCSKWGVKGHRRAWLDPSQEIQVGEAIKIKLVITNSDFELIEFLLHPNDILFSRNILQPMPLTTSHEVPGNVRVSPWLTKCAVKKIIYVHI